MSTYQCNRFFIFSNAVKFPERFVVIVIKRNGTLLLKTKFYIVVKFIIRHNSHFLFCFLEFIFCIARKRFLAWLPCLLENISNGIP